MGRDKLCDDVSSHYCAERVDIGHEIFVLGLLYQKTDKLADALVDAVHLGRGHRDVLVLAEGFVCEGAHDESCDLC